MTRPPSPQQIELKAAAAAAVGSICVGFVPYFVTELQRAGMDTVSVLFFRYIVALTLLLPLAWWRSPDLWREWSGPGRWLFLNGVTLGALQTFGYFKAIETIATSIVVTCFYSYLVLALALDRYVFKLAITWGTVGAVIVLLAGVVLTSWPGFGTGQLEPVGLTFAVLSAVGYAVYIAVAYPLTRRITPFAGAAFIYLSLAAAFGVAAAYRGLTLPPRPELWLNLIAIGTFGGAVQIASFAYALPRLSSSGYAVIVCLELVTVVLVGVALLDERLIWLQWLGVLLVLAGILIERLAKARRSR